MKKNDMKKLEIKHTTWNLFQLFESDNDPRMADERKAIEAAYRAFAQKWKANNGYLKYPAVLKEALDEYEKLNRFYASGGKERYYFSKRVAQNEEDAVIKGRMANVRDFSMRLHNEILFFELGLAKIDAGIQKNFLAHESLKPYRHYLERLFAAGEHILGEDVERALILKAAPAHIN